MDESKLEEDENLGFLLLKKRSQSLASKLRQTILLEAYVTSDCELILYHTLNSNILRNSAKPDLPFRHESYSKVWISFRKLVRGLFRAYEMI